MNTAKTSTLIIILILMFSSMFYIIDNLSIEAQVNQYYDEPEKLYPATKDINITKIIIDRDTGLEADLPYKTWIGDTFDVIIEVTNNAFQNILNLTMVSRESNLTALGYKNNWLDIQGDRNKNWSSLAVGLSVSASYTVTPKYEENYVFPASNVSFAYANGTTRYFSLSNLIKFNVYEQEPSLRVEKFLLINGKETADGRMKRSDRDFKIRIKFTNFYHDPINVTIHDGDPNATAFEFNSTHLMKSFLLVLTNVTKNYDYNINATMTGTYYFPVCDVNYTALINNVPQELTEQSNTVKLYVYDPIYEGPDWTRKVPLLSVTKYFNITKEDGTIEKRTKISYFNDSLEIVNIIINITNYGVVTAYNISIVEETYRDWVFETIGVPAVWLIDNLTQGESQLFNYTIYPKIVGSFKIEATKVTYSFIDQGDLLPELNYVLYSNVIEINIEVFAPEPDLSMEWLTTVGISVGIILLAVLPLVITFINYRRRRRPQKGM